MTHPRNQSSRSESSSSPFKWRGVDRNSKFSNISDLSVASKASSGSTGSRGVLSRMLGSFRGQHQQEHKSYEEKEDWIANYNVTHWPDRPLQDKRLRPPKTAEEYAKMLKEIGDKSLQRRRRFEAAHRKGTDEGTSSGSLIHEPGTPAKTTRSLQADFGATVSMANDADSNNGTLDGTIPSFSYSSRSPKGNRETYPPSPLFIKTQWEPFAGGGNDDGGEEGEGGGEVDVSGRGGGRQTEKGKTPASTSASWAGDHFLTKRNFKNPHVEENEEDDDSDKSSESAVSPSAMVIRVFHSASVKRGIGSSIRRPSTSLDFPSAQSKPPQINRSTSTGGIRSIPEDISTTRTIGEAAAGGGGGGEEEEDSPAISEAKEAKMKPPASMTRPVSPVVGIGIHLDNHRWSDPGTPLLQTMGYAKMGTEFLEEPSNRESATSVYWEDSDSEVSTLNSFSLQHGRTPSLMFNSSPDSATLSPLTPMANNPWQATMMPTESRCPMPGCRQLLRSVADRKHNLCGPCRKELQPRESTFRTGNTPIRPEFVTSIDDFEAEVVNSSRSTPVLAQAEFKTFQRPSAVGLVSNIRKTEVSGSVSGRGPRTDNTHKDLVSPLASRFNEMHKRGDFKLQRAPSGRKRYVHYHRRNIHPLSRTPSKRDSVSRGHNSRLQRSGASRTSEREPRGIPSVSSSPQNHIFPDQMPTPPPSACRAWAATATDNHEREDARGSKTPSHIVTQLAGWPTPPSPTPTSTPSPLWDLTGCWDPRPESPVMLLEAKTFKPPERTGTKPVKKPSLVQIPVSSRKTTVRIARDASFRSRFSMSSTASIGSGSPTISAATISRGMPPSPLSRPKQPRRAPTKYVKRNTGALSRGANNRRKRALPLTTTRNASSNHTGNADHYALPIAHGVKKLDLPAWHTETDGDDDDDDIYRDIDSIINFYLETDTDNVENDRRKAEAIASYFVEEPDQEAAKTSEKLDGLESDALEIEMRKKGFF